MPSRARPLGGESGGEGGGARTVNVTFSLPAAAGARSAAVAGEFNAWSIDAHPMARRVDGSLAITVELAVGRRYAYRYWINDQDWENDWHADAYVPNEYGGNNSQIDLTETSRRVQDAGPAGA